MTRRSLLSPSDEDPITAAVEARDRDALALVREALAADRVFLAYQPVVGALTGDVAFQEGLIRLRDPTGRVIPASHFIDSVENTELGRQIDCAALRHGLDALARVPTLRLSVNMSARSIGYPRWMTILDHGLARDPTLADRLILEVTERSTMKVPELVRTFMSDLQSRGVTFALDDFGAGHTSFRYLKEFYFDILKIDGGFVAGCDSDADNQCILGALISIGQQFDMFTVAESVETAAEAQFLVDAGIDCLQGFHYGAPATRPAWLDPATELRPAG
ncbi:EAL domain-containing protein [Jannaschia marina]|uniref:EAL domain-containing protein n=1 Tax=Jannaschia marina TaxID=2741674 RepID=UPI0015CE8552|nr:EAL domain-containing protein [Jannaschia marina]